MNTAIVPVFAMPPEVQKSNAQVEIAKHKVAQEVQAMLIIAQSYPRDQARSYMRIMESCKRLSLAEKSMYSYPRGGTTVTGPSIRLAEVLAQNWGNLKMGVREIERGDGYSLAESFCWDLEMNVYQTKEFEVPHEISTKQGKKIITDSRDIYELVANNGSRRLRACILGIIPADITESAVQQCKATLEKGSGEPLVDRIKKMLMNFAEYEIGVSHEMIEERLGHKMDLTTTAEIVELWGIYTAIRDKQAKREDFFKFPKAEDVSEGKAAALSDKLRAAVATKGE